MNSVWDRLSGMCQGASGQLMREVWSFLDSFGLKMLIRKGRAQEWADALEIEEATLVD